MRERNVEMLNLGSETYVNGAPLAYHVISASYRIAMFISFKSLIIIVMCRVIENS